MWSQHLIYTKQILKTPLQYEQQQGYWEVFGCGSQKGLCHELTAAH